MFIKAHKFWGDFGISITISLVWSLAFELPIPVLEAFIFGSGS